MKLTGGRIVLALSSLAFAVFGVLYCLNPVGMASKVGISLGGGGAIIDVQGMYGGLEIGLGCFLALCAMRIDRVRIGLLAGAFALGGIALSRTLAIARFGMPDSSVAMLLGLDYLGAILNVVFVLRYRTQQ